MRRRPLGREYHAGATSLHGVTMPWLLPGLTLNTNSTDYQTIKHLCEMRFNGETWELLNEVN
jgi:hypothetical protein